MNRILDDKFPNPGVRSLAEGIMRSKDYDSNVVAGGAVIVGRTQPSDVLMDAILSVCPAARNGLPAWELVLLLKLGVPQLCSEYYDIKRRMEGATYTLGVIETTIESRLAQFKVTRAKTQGRSKKAAYAHWKLQMSDRPPLPELGQLRKMKVSL